MSIFRRAAERRGTPARALVVGLGNPGIKYHGTRHNVGAEVVEHLAQRAGRSLGDSRKELSLVAELPGPEGRIVVAFPQTFMNESGRAVSALVARHGITDPGDVIVVHDELDLPVGELRVKVGGGLAGHNGLKSIRQHLGSAEFVRVRIGIDRPPGRGDTVGWVLKPPGKADRAELDVVTEEAADAVGDIVRLGAAEAMNRWNGRRRG